MSRASFLLLALLCAAASAARTHDASAFDRYKPSKSLTEGRNYQSITRNAGSVTHDADPIAKLPVCRQLGDTALQNGRWRLHEDTGQFFFEPRGCRLRRRTHAEALQCLTGKRVSFAGDSVSRQHFTTFVTWIATGHLPQPYDDGMFSPTNAYKWPTWVKYFEGLRERVLAGPPRSSPGPRPTLSFDLITPAGEGDVKAKRMHLAMHGLSPGNQSLYLDYCFAGMTPSWLEAGQGALTSMFNGQVPHTPDFVVFNMGAWWSLTQRSDKGLFKDMGLMYEHGAALAQRHNSSTTFLWRPSMMRNWAKKNKRLSELARGEGWKVLDTLPVFNAMVSQQLWLNMRRSDGKMDALHFLPIMYEQMIDMLLHRICPA